MATVNLGSIKFKWKGTYSGATAYTVDDVVEYNGSSYICILASTGNLPTNATYFEQMSSAGTNGTNGTDFGTILTTQGDLVYRDGSGIQRLGAGTAGQVLQTGGAGANPSWGDVGGGLVQVVSATKDDTWASSGSGNYQGVTGLSLNITPTSASNKIFITSNVQLYQNDFGGGISLFRDGSQIVTPASVGSRSVANASSYDGTAQSASNLGLSYLDSPSSTSALTYQIYVFVRGGTYYVNRSNTDTDSSDFARTISTITAMEVSV